MLVTEVRELVVLVDFVSLYSLIVTSHKELLSSCSRLEGGVG